MIETIGFIYWFVGLWVYFDTDDVASAILWPVWAVRKVWRDE